MVEKNEKKRLYDEKRACVCVLCGERKTAGSWVYEMHGFPYCEDCLFFSDVETVIRICGKGKREWFEHQGFTAIRIV